jgi:ribosomal protein S18 acetylase RimI-like enzyme
MNSFTIRTAQCSDVPLLEDVENSAIQAFYVLPGFVPMGGALPQDLLHEICDNGQLWVATGADDKPVGFIAASDVDDLLYIEEMSVALEFQKNGIGRDLMNTLIDYAIAAKYMGIGLTTRRDAAWNMPFYKKLGFTETADDLLPVQLLKIIQDERRSSVNPAVRCAMIKTL